MKQLFKFFPLSIAFGLLISGCNMINTESDNADYIPVQLEEDGNWSFIGPDGKLKYENEFKQSPSMVINGFFSIEESEGYTLYKAGEKPVAVKNCEGLKGVGYMQDGLIPVVRPKSRITVVDENGTDKFTLDPFKGKEIVWCAGGFEEGLLMVKLEDETYGYINKKGEMVIKPQYDVAYGFSEGLALVKKDDTSLIIDKKGETVIKIKKDWKCYSGFYYGVMVAEDANDRLGFMDKKGEFIKCPSKVKGIPSYDDSYYVFYDGENAGVMTRKDNEVIIRAKYENIQIIDGDRFFVRDDKGKCAILDKEGKVEVDLEDYEGALAIKNFGIFAKDKKTIVLLDDKGKMRKDCEFYDISFKQSACNTVSSDFFSLESLANTIADRLTKDGFGKARIGMGPKGILTSPNNYEYTSTAYPDSLSGTGYRFNYRTELEFTGRLADSRWDYDYYSYTGRWTYYWNPVTLKAIYININAETDLGENAVKAVASAIGKKGFNKYAEINRHGSGGVMLTSKELLIGVISENKSSEMKIIITKCPDTKGLQNLKKELDNALSESNDINMKNMATEEEVVVEEVCDSLAPEEVDVAPAY